MFYRLIVMNLFVRDTLSDVVEPRSSPFSHELQVLHSEQFINFSSGPPYDSSSSNLCAQYGHFILKY